MECIKKLSGISKTVILSVSALAFTTVSAFAAEGDGAIDFGPLTAKIDWTSVITAVLGVCAGVALLYLAMGGAKHILSTIRKS